jgi:nitrate reductase gamma subunit
MVDALLFSIGIVLPYVTAVIFVGGLAFRAFRWLSIPVPTKVMVAPAPTTWPGVFERMSLDLVVFRSLMKGGWKLWLGGWLFHILLGITLLTHLINFFDYGLWNSVGYGWYEVAGYAGIIFGSIVAFLLLRRLLHPGVRYVSKPSDYGLLLLLVSIIFLGDYTRTFGAVNIGDVSQYLNGLLTLQPILPPNNPAFLLHLFLAQVFLMYLPFSKVSHLVGWVLSPTRNQRNDARARWHRNSWNPQVELEPYASYVARYQRELEELGPGGERK